MMMLLDVNFNAEKRYDGLSLAQQWQATDRLSALNPRVSASVLAVPMEPSALGME